jgi:hypothetical protein
VMKRCGLTSTREVKGNDKEQILHPDCSAVAADGACH